MILLGALYYFTNQGNPSNDDQTVIDDNSISPHSAEIQTNTSMMKVGFGLSTYVSPKDAMGIDEGKLQDGELLVDTSVAILILNGEDRIVYAYLDDIESSIWFNEEGSIGTNKDISQWPSLKESDDEYYTSISDYESKIIGMNKSEFEKYSLELSDEAFPTLQINDIGSAINSAFANMTTVDSIQNIGFGNITRYQLEDASEEKNGNIKVMSSLAVVSTSEAGKLTAVIMDEVETNAEFDINGKVLTSRFDTRSKLEKGLDGQIDAIAEVPKSYVEALKKIESQFLNQPLEKLTEIETSEEGFVGIEVAYNDIINALLKAANSLIAWY